MRTLHKMFGKSTLASICIVGALIIALFPAAVVGAGSSESGFHISQWTGETWEDIYQHQFQVQYSTEAFTVDVVDGKVALRIVQVGTPFADVDQISLMVEGEELTPEYARYTGSGQSIVEDILELDHNVVIAHEQEIEASWDVPAGYGSATVYLTANEYGHGLPFRFPETGYATYEVGSNIGPITVDGLITETDGTVPLYSPYWQPSSGHPDGYTYIYVCDDEQYVYFSLDITMDNTNEYGEDWAEIRILQPDGSEQTFRIDDFDNTWGESGFGLTSKVSYKHQTCEFAIPKNIIGNEDIEFSLAYYGTGSVGADAYANAMVDPLVITINGTSSSGQVFNVGDTIYVEGYVHSIANASVDYGVYLLETTLGCDLWLNPGGLEHAWDGEADSTISSGNYTELFSEYDGSIWFTHTLTTPGDYTITLDSDASASVSYTNGESIEGTSSYAPQKSLSFYVSSTPQAPEADFHASGTIVCANVTIDFFDDSTGTYDSWYWDFGDGSNSTLESPSHAYTNVGNYTVSLTVSGGYGEDTETKADYITVLLVDGKLFMVDGGNSTIYELDPSTGAVLNTIPTPIATDGGGDGLAYGDGRMFFTTIDTNIIYEIDPSTGEIINRLGPESKVAVYAADTAPYTADVQAKLTSTGLFSQVDAFLVESGDPVPTLAELQEYDAVLVYSDGEFGNSTAMGDVLADYVDAGGGAVIATFAFWDPAGWDGGIGGRISSGGYLPFTQGEQSAGTNLTLVADEPEHPILSGVTSFNGGLTSWFNTVNLTSEADLVAHWSNDVPLIAVQYPMAEGAGRVVGLNFFPVSSDAQSPFWDSSTDGDLLMANSLLFAAFNYEYEIDALGFSGDALYALQYGDNATIRVLDPDTGANITTLEPGIPLVGGLTFAGTRNSLFVSNNGESAPSFGMTNKGFESGNFVGWNVYTGTSGTAWVVTLWNSPNGTNYTAANGDRFALLQNGDQNESTYISQNFTVDAGDIIGGWAFFSTREDPINDPGFNDQCSVDIMDGATLVDRVFYADTYDANWPDGPWTYWSWEAPSAGNYTLLARVVNIGDSEVSSYMGLDIPLEGPSTIYEISAESGAVLNSFPDPVGSGYGLYGLGFSSARDTLFLGFYESNMIYEVDPDTGYVINSFAGPEGAAISALAADECGGAPTTPEADFHASNTTVCGNVTIDFFDDSTGTYDSWYWDFGDGTNSTLPNPSHSYTSAGNHTVSLTISDGYGDDTETKVNYVTVLLAPEASFHASITMACAGVTFNFTDDSTGACDGWYWDFGDGSNSTDQNPSHAYASAANYTVSLTVSNCCCQDTETKIDYITVLPQPQADFHANITTACAGVTINFTDDSTGVCDSWYWDFGDGSNSTIQSPSHAYTSAGNYTVLVHVSNAWCEDEETKTDYITVLPLPEADFHASDTSPSVNVEIDFLDDSSGTYDSWYWDFGDGTNSTVQSPSHTYTIVGNYTVSLTISNGCGSDTETKVNYIEVLPLPEADFHANNTTVCANVTIGFFDDSTGTYDSWYWDFGDGSSSTVQNPSHAYTNAGSYTVSLNISGGYGEDAETKADYITILPLPEADFHASNTTVCANVTIDFFDDSTGTYDSWYWDFGDGSNSTLQNPTHAYANAGNYTVSLTISNGCGSDTETKIDYMTVLPLPEANFHASDTSPSVNVEIDFSDDSTGTYDSWYWDFGDGSNSTVQNPSHTYTIVGNYTVSLTISNGCGSDTETKVDYIQVAPLSEANTVIVEAEADGTPLAVPIDWSWDSNSSADTTPFDVEDIPDGTELSLTAPAMHTQNYTFYVFDHWSVGATDYDPGDVDITFDVNGDLTAIVHYTQVISVHKTLDRCDNGLIGLPGYVVYDPNALPFKTSIYFGMTIMVNAFADGIDDIRVEDGIGADLAVTALRGGSYYYTEHPGKGKNSATKCVWELYDMDDGDWESLGISAWTATNPKGKQQYASPGEHTLNSGPKVFFTYDGQDYMLQGPSITVNVVK